MRRTIVISDLHGFEFLLDNALADAGYTRGDRLIVAGDLIDIGPDDCVTAAQRKGATILAGNHEVSAALGVDIAPQNRESPAKGPKFARRFVSGDWPLAVAVEGWLITHGGLSTLFEDDIERAGHDPELIAASLNERFRGELRRFLQGGVSMWGLGRSRIIGSEFGPLWFRGALANQVPDGLRQIVGHTPCELFSAEQVRALSSKPFLLVDPGAHLEPDVHRFRYAIIENGEAEVVAGCHFLQPAGAR